MFEKLLEKMDSVSKTMAGMQSYPHCDPSTGEIHNCEENTLSWFHEQGHLEFTKRSETSALQMWQGIFFLFWMISTTLAFLNKYMLWLSFPMLGLYLFIDVYEVYWSNSYAKMVFERQKQEHL